MKAYIKLFSYSKSAVLCNNTLKLFIQVQQSSKVWKKTPPCMHLDGYMIQFQVKSKRFDKWANIWQNQKND